MKKLLFSALCVLGFTASQAQVEFRPGLRAGANFSHFTQTTNPSEKYSALTDFYVGLIGELDLAKVYSLQPEINYTRQGTKFEQLLSNNTIYKEDVKVSYMSIGIANKFKFSGFNIYVGPTVDININDKSKTLSSQSNNQYYDPYYNQYYMSSYNDDVSDIDLGFFVGAGYSFTKNLGFDVRIKRGVIPVDWRNNDGSNVVISGGLFYTFNTKK